MALQLSRRLATSNRGFAVKQAVWEKPVLMGMYQVRYSSISTETEVKVSAAENINGPISTLPPKLEEVVKEEGTSTFKHLFRTGKAYVGCISSGRAISWC